MRASQFAACAAAFLCLPFTSVVGQDGLEDELKALVQSMNRFVEVLERQEQKRATESGLRRVGLAVQILDIRARQQESLQKELRSLEDQEQRTLGYIASNETKMENLKKQISESVDETKRQELEANKNDIVVYLEINKKRLQHYAQRRVDLENRLIEGERLTAEVEDIVESWLEDSQSRPSSQRGE